MELNLKGKVVAVTGASTGIGRAVAVAFAKEGCKVAVCARGKSGSIDEIRKEFEENGWELFVGTADVSDVTQITAFADDVVKTYGRLDVWVNNVSRQEKTSLLEETKEGWDGLVATNITSVVFGMQAAARYMKEQGGGVILNTSSFAASMPSAYKASYAASKCAVDSLTRSAAGEFGPFGIRVCGVAPASTRTPLAMKSGRDFTQAVKKNAIARMGEPEECANAFVFLASDAASYITGTTLDVTGGKMVIQDCEKAAEERR